MMKQSALIQYRWTCSVRWPTLPWQQHKAFRQVRRGQKTDKGLIVETWMWTVLLFSSPFLSQWVKQCLGLAAAYWTMKLKTFFFIWNLKTNLDGTDPAASENKWISSLSWRRGCRASATVMVLVSCHDEHAPGFLLCASGSYNSPQ